MTFIKGKSGNPKGRPSNALAIANIVRSVVDPIDLVEVLLDIARDKQAEAKHRIQAARELFDRGWGKAHQVIELEGSEARPVPFDASKLSMDELNHLESLLVAGGVVAPDVENESAGDADAASDQ